MRVNSNSYDSFKQMDHAHQSQDQPLIGQQINVVNHKNNSKTEKHEPISYRPDIDGLRTIAVGIVVIFHAYPTLIPGGFIGVDIFFVISGYLITQILIKENLKNKFTYFNFYNRRVKRIYPALLIVLMFVLFVGVRKLELRSLKIMSSTMAASTAFGANLEILTQQKGYFDPDTKTNPLLHLWSLGVQQQFYIFWPFIISLLVTKFSSKALKLLVGFTVLSLIANLIVVHINSQFDFYFPFTRFWQMAVGGLLAFKAVTITDARIANILSLSGIAIVLIFSLLLSEEFLYPGWWAIFPTLGSALIIQAGSESLVNKHLLSTRPMVFVGKISYSLYLWHWPLLVFSRLLYPEGSTSIFAKTYVMVLLAVAFSIASYYLIENPMRFAKQRYIFHVLLFAMLIVGITSIFVYQYSSKHQIASQTSIKQNIQFQLNIYEKYFRFNSPQNHSLLNNSLSVIDKQYELGMIPQKSDYVVINGREVPNVSKNKNRKSASFQKIQHGIKRIVSPWGKLIGKRIDQNSRFYKPETVKQAYFHYEVINEGRQNLLFCVGDSHAQIGHRFMKLYKDSVQDNKTDEFPTIVVLVMPKSILAPNNQGYDFIINWIQQFRPQRVLFIYRWAKWYRLGDDQSVTGKSYFRQNIQNLIAVIKNFTEKGINFTVSTFKPEGQNFNSYKMIDNSGNVIQNNVKYINRTQNLAPYEESKIFLEQKLKSVGAQIIDFADNQCWEDICEVTLPSGFPYFVDNNHFTPTFNLFWVTVVDHLTQFQKQPKQNQKDIDKIKFQQSMTPNLNDYYEKNKTTIPNSSKHRKRQPLTQKKLKFSMQKGQPSWSSLIFQKKIDKTSKFYKQKVPKQLFHYEIINQGKKNLVLCVGDTHAQVGIRFMKLYQQAIKNNKVQDFPTIVLLVIAGRILTPGEQQYQFVANWIQQFKPNRILFVYKWAPDWFVSSGIEPKKYHSMYFYKNAQIFFDMVKKISQRGINITVNTFRPQGKEFNPINMVNKDGKTMPYMQPFQLNWFKAKYSTQIAFFQKGLKQSGAEIVDFADNLCWNNICEVLTPSGYNIYWDNSHFMSAFSKNWFSVIDKLAFF